MKHYEFYRLAQGADVMKVQEKVWKAWEKLDAELDWLNHPVVLRSCNPADDFDLMSVAEMDGEELLEQCLTHPRYVKLTAALKDLVASKATFDHY